MQIKIPTVYMRGGTSKALFFHKADLPNDLEMRNRFLLAAFGSPDANGRQLDGIGGATTSTSKVAIISPSKDPSYDVNYEFGQVSIDKPTIIYEGNCGNISSALGPFAIDEGLVDPIEPITKVNVYQVNTKKRIVAEVPVYKGSYQEEGNFVIDGVPRSGSKILLHFFDPGGSLSGKLLPTGNVIDEIDIPGLGIIDATIIDAANPLIFVHARDLGLKGIEISEVDKDQAIKSKLEAIRAKGAVLLGLASCPEKASLYSQRLPMISFVSEPNYYKSLSGRMINKEEVHVVARVLSMGTVHKSVPVTAAICIAGAAKIKGTVIYQVSREVDTEEEMILIGHPGGIMSVSAILEKRNGEYIYKRSTIARTARRLMDGFIHVPESFLR
ncbi:2-methylaconitate cis-trans isomerase PrpF family protein [Thermodesulfobacteriota bacterium]